MLHRRGRARGAIAELARRARPARRPGLETYADCPLQYLLERDPAAQAARGARAHRALDALTRGTLVHSILERFIASARRAARTHRTRTRTAQALARDHRRGARRRRGARPDRCTAPLGRRPDRRSSTTSSPGSSCELGATGAVHAERRSRSRSASLGRRAPRARSRATSRSRIELAERRGAPGRA